MRTKAYKDFERTLERAKALLEAHKVVTRTQGRPPWFLSDILRAALVFIMGSLDSYIHDVICENAYKVLHKQKGRNIGKKLLDVLKESIPYEKSFEILFEEKPGSLINSAIRKRNADRTFMKPEKMEEALRILNIDDLWGSAARKFSRRKDGLRTVFERYAKRRDKIAHEGDVGKATRSKGRLRSIRRPYIEECFTDVEKLVKFVDEIVGVKLQ